VAHRAWADKGLLCFLGDPHPDKWDRSKYTLLAFNYWAKEEATTNRKKLFETLIDLLRVRAQT
jgi:hypothetical protein